MIAASPDCAQILVNKIKTLIGRCCLIAVAVALTFCSARASVDHTDLVVSIDAWQQPLKNVLIEISKQISWKVVVDENLLETKISGRYRDAELGEFLNRSLKGENLVVLFDVASKTVDVRSFGSEPKAHNVAVVSPIADVISSPQEVTENGVHDELSSQQFLENSDVVDPLTGMKFVDISAGQAVGQEIYSYTEQHSEVIDPVSGLTLAEIAALPVPEQE
jgi:hypothetical protein